MDPALGAVTIGTELTRLCTVGFGTKVLGPFQRGASVVMMSRHLGDKVSTEIHGSELGVELGSEVGAVCFGAKLGAKGLGTECVGPKIKFVASHPNLQL
jgi:hypothetical protein